MTSSELALFKKNTDATGTNRGFLYQYLKTLNTWIKNFIANNKVEIYCETEDDIKELDLQWLIEGRIKASESFS